MPGLFAAQRLAVLVDTANMYHCARAQFGGRIDYRRLLHRVVGDRALVRAIAFVVRGEDVDVSPFIEALDIVGFESRIKTGRRRVDGSIRANWDVGIALCAAELVDKVDAMAIVSGDGSLTDVADYLAARGVRVEVYAFDGSVSNELISRAHIFEPLERDVLMDSRYDRDDRRDRFDRYERFDGGDNIGGDDMNDDGNPNPDDNNNF